MSEHPIQGLMTTAMENIKEMIDVNTIIGEPVQTPDGSIILAVSKVGFGFAAGGSEFYIDKAGAEDSSFGQGMPFGGGSGGGVSITPVAFLIVNQQGVKMLHLDENTHLYEKILDLAPNAVEKIRQMLEKNKQQTNVGNHPGNDGNGFASDPNQFSL
ncbi:GerW family sporulation protein [Caldibacillus debilis]|uniref:GerW family sporulation protein n=1 Tax=Caldibacillus debilis TaxID=301148 RepID=UPI000B5638EF|nr:GerW family sporulation protein [Caldibacillus debilis]OUM91060.1 MAG: sporulation protein YtfJ [Caldibacillus debilis]